MHPSTSSEIRGICVWQRNPGKCAKLLTIKKGISEGHLGRKKKQCLGEENQNCSVECTESFYLLFKFLLEATIHVSAGKQPGQKR